MKQKNTTCPILITTFLSLAMCNAAEKLGTYKLRSREGNSTITLYRDSTFIEKVSSNSENKKCKGRWWPVNEKDSIIETMTLSCGLDIYTLTPKRKLTIKGHELIETRE